MAHHAGAAAGRTNRGFSSKEVEVPSPQNRRIAGAAGVRHRLSAAGLLGIVMHRAPRPSQHRDGGHRHLRMDLVEVTGNEEVDIHSSGSVV